jgi:hypothetical protein
MSFDAHANFVITAVATAPSPATSGTSLTVATGKGALFPAAPFNCTVWPADTNPLSTNAEIVRVTAVVGDVLTITRAQEGSSARAILVGDQIAATITAKTLTDVEAAAGTASLCRNLVTMPSASGDPGAAGDYAVNGDELAFYIASISEWRWITLFAK